MYFKLVSYHALRTYFGMLFPMGRIQLYKAFNVLWSNKLLAQQLIGLKTFNKFHIEHIFLQLLVTGIIECIV